ncbi:hypothetical protein [Candidatus Pyrohabitans sp.]
MQQALKAKPLREYVRSVAILRCDHAINCQRKKCSHHSLHFHIICGCRLQYCNRYLEDRLLYVACTVAALLRVYKSGKKQRCEHCEYNGEIIKDYRNRMVVAICEIKRGDEPV